MHPHIADLMVTEHIDRIRAEAYQGRLTRTARGESTRRPSWRARLSGLIHGQSVRPELTAAPRRG